MTTLSSIDRLDHAIDFLVAHPQAALPPVEDDISELVEIAGELRYLPRTEFKLRLRAELQEPAPASQAHGAAQPSRLARREDAEPILPTLLGLGGGAYPLQRSSVALSFVLHAAAVVLIASSGFWLTQHRQQLTHQVTTIFSASDYALPVAPGKAGGGGGGGDGDKLAASKGTPPRFAREQLTPPAVVLRNPEPKLPVEATVIGPPQLTFSPQSPTGDPLSALLTPSNGAGSGGGIGSGSGGGVGSGHDAGVGPGWGGGIGGGVYRVGGGVSEPRIIYDPDPEFSEEARKAKYQGVVVLSVIVGPDGRPHDIRVARSLGMGLDEKAIEAVNKWRFVPSMKDGRPVPVEVNIEVHFRLY
jgi:TonB family protein